MSSSVGAIVNRNDPCLFLSTAVGGAQMEEGAERDTRSEAEEPAPLLIINLFPRYLTVVTYIAGIPRLQ
jgi:hypothetical protein